ncbi:MAG: putative signal peptide peptidase SppA, partial [Alphaproteobacteria bacterium MarineAlpha5_Bin11]
NLIGKIMKSFFLTFSKTFGIMLALLVILAVFLLFSNLIGRYVDTAYNNLEFVEGDKNSNNLVILLDLEGPILSNSSQKISFFDSQIIFANDIEKIFFKLKEEINLKGIIISINSPGGTVSASNKFYESIIAFQETTKIPIYIHTDELLASGGVWAAVGAKKIYASYGALIGNIGVKGPSWFYYNEPISIKQNFLDKDVATKEGIEFYQTFAGRSKDIFNEFREPTQEEIDSIQNMLESIYEKFLIIVSKNRKIEKKYIRNDLGALIYDSDSAKKKGLIDEVYNFNKSKEKILSELNISNDYKMLSLKNNQNIISQNLPYLFSKYEDNYYKKLNLRICNMSKMQISLLSNYYSNNC